MKKILAILAATALLAGCGASDRSLAWLTGSGSKTCVDGVVYLQFTSGVTVQYDPAGKVVACK